MDTMDIIDFMKKYDCTNHFVEECMPDIIVNINVL
jgi:hypothetical protein